MAFPVILQKLFQNSGAGSLLNRSIIPAANATERGGVTLSDTADSSAAADGVAATPTAVTAAVAAALATLSAVSYTSQSLTDAQKTQARTNISAAVNTVAPVGSFLCFAGNTVPAGYLLCNGAAVSRTTYAALFAVIGTTYGAGDGSTTFNLPNCDGRVLQGVSDLTKVGVALDSQLPNITGTSGIVSSGQYPLRVTGGSGAFVQSTSLSESSYALHTTSWNPHQPIESVFNASLANAIYGNFSKVQTPAIQVLTAIRYA